MLRNTSENIRGVTVKSIKPGESYLNSADPTGSYLIKEYQYFNGTRHDLSVVDRSGVIVKIPYCPTQRSCRFTIRVTWRVRVEFIDEFIDNMRTQETLDNEELNNIVNYVIATRNKFRGYINVSLDYEINENEFNAQCQTLYFINHDIVISTLSSNKIPKHPFSYNKVNQFKLNGEFENNGITTKLVYVDNTGTKGPRYVNTYGLVQRLDPIADITHADGIYFYSKEKKINSVDEYEVKKIHVPLEEAHESIGIFMTYEEAQYGGDIKNGAKIAAANAEKEILEYKRVNAGLEAELLKSKTEYQLKDHNYNMMREDLQRTHDLLKASEDNRKILASNEINNRKHQYEMESINRKDWSDLLKFVPGLIIAFGAVITAVMKLSSQK